MGSSWREERELLTEGVAIEAGSEWLSAETWFLRE
jgi:hypothetical protein